MAGASLRESATVVGPLLWSRSHNASVLNCLKTADCAMFEELAESIEQSLESVQVRPSWTKGRVIVALSGGADSCALLHSAYMSLKDRCELIALLA